MSETKDLAAEVQQVVDQRTSIEERLRTESATAEHEREYGRLQKTLLQLFKRATADDQRIAIILEIMRIMENRLVYLQNFVVEPTPENRVLARVVSEFLDHVSADVLTPLEKTYYRGVGSLYSGDVGSAQRAFQEACESEESDEANDIKYKSFVLLGHLSHQEKDYGKARELADKSVQYSHNPNVTAQALALKALNSYALREFDDAIAHFEEALTLFDPSQPLFNAYFHRNALLFSASIHLERKEYELAEDYYRRVLEHVEPASYDHFDALSQLGKICYRTGRYEESARTLTRAVETHRVSENEYLVDTYFWLARAHLKNDARDEARKMLQKVASSEVHYPGRAQAVELLRQVG
jgi:tetratricopeptide (TPR) repeat protein